MDSSVVCLYFLPRDDNAEPEISLVGFVGVKQSARGPRTSLTFGFAWDLVELPTSSERMGVKNRLHLSIAACSWPRILLLPLRSTDAPLCGPLYSPACNLYTCSWCSLLNRQKQRTEPCEAPWPQSPGGWKLQAVYSALPLDALAVGDAG